MGCGGSKTKEEEKSGGGGGESLNTPEEIFAAAIKRNTFTGAERDKILQRADRLDCHHVYDGDTMTLNDERRVRFLGLDTPEIKEKQALATDSRDFVKDLIISKAGKKVLLTYEAEKEDHYGRLLATVWVEIAPPCGGDNVLVMVNGAVLAAGLGRFYSPGGSNNNASELTYKNHLLQQQSFALQNSLYLWNPKIDGVEPLKAKVYTTRNGRAYHERGCEHISKSRNPQELPERDAIMEGKNACRTCLNA